jgi:hypothetical protein
MSVPPPIPTATVLPEAPNRELPVVSVWQDHFWWKLTVLVLLLIMLDVPFLTLLKPRVEWEYRIETFPSSSGSMNDLGYYGWELVSARPVIEDKKVSYEMIFKRHSKNPAMAGGGTNRGGGFGQ